MAEIKIEKKNMAWLWVLLFLGIAALVYFIAFANKNENTTETVVTTDTVSTTVTTETRDTDLISVKENNATVVAYTDFAEPNRNRRDLDHAYANEALLKLTDATQAMADEVGYDAKSELNKVKEYAEKITRDPFDKTHADNIRKADDILANVLQKIQQAKFPSLANEAAELKNAAGSIKTGVLAFDQRSEIQAFFYKAAELLRKMN